MSVDSRNRPVSDPLVTRLLTTPGLGHTLRYVGALHQTTLHRKGKPDISCVGKSMDESLRDAFAVLDIETGMTQYGFEMLAHEPTTNPTRAERGSDENV